MLMEFVFWGIISSREKSRPSVGPCLRQDRGKESARGRVYRKEGLCQLQEKYTPTGYRHRGHGGPPSRRKATHITYTP